MVMTRLARNYAWFRRRGVVAILAFGYLVLTFLTIEQARTISSQQALIHQLFQDSLDLTALRLQQHARPAAAPSVVLPPPSLESH